jgi:hypothetical protein
MVQISKLHGGVQAVMPDIELTGSSGSLDPDRLQAVIERASASEDYMEGRRAFAEERAVFRGR